MSYTAPVGNGKRLNYDFSFVLEKNTENVHFQSF